MTTTYGPRVNGPPTTAVSKAGVNILRNQFLRRFLLGRYTVLSMQVFTTLLFVWVIYDGLFGVQAAGDNFATLGVWVLFFWPVILLSTLLSGRAWCAVCPLGALTAMANRFGLGRSFPKKLRNVSLSLLLFVVVLWILRPTLGISESPAATAWFLIAWGIAAVGLGYAYTSRAFCQYVCPLAAPLGVMARIAPVELRAKNSEKINPACRACSGKECFNGNEKIEGCPMGEYPATMEGNQRCIFCLKCLKSCPAKNVLQIRLRWPFRELFNTWHPSEAEALTVVALVSVFLWHMALGHGDRVPPLFRDWSHAIWSTGLESIDHHNVEYVMILMLGLIAVSAGLAVAAYISSKIAHISLRQSFIHFSFAYVALVAMRALGYMVGDILTRSGDLWNYATATMGIYLYHPSALMDGMFKPLLQGTGYHTYGALLTLPLILALPLTWFIAYKIAHRLTQTPARSVVTAAPHFVLLTGIVIIYEWAYLVGYRVTGQ